MEYGIGTWSQIRYREMRGVRSSRKFLGGFIGASVLLHMLLMLCGDVHPNPGPSTWQSSLSICHANIRSIRGLDKFSEISCELQGKFDIITFSETWLSNKDKSSDYSMAGYQAPFRRDRADNSGYGGVMAYVSSNVGCKRREDLESPNFEGMWLEILAKNEKLFLLVIYRTESSTTVDFWQDLQGDIGNVRSLYNPKIMLIGDLNADPKTRHGKLLAEFAESNFFTMHIKEPTRVSQNSSSVLDQILTNFPQMVSEALVCSPVSNSDHCLISTTIKFKSKNKKAYIRRMWDFKRANFELYRQSLSKINWNNCFESPNIDQICFEVTNHILSAATAAIPNKLVTIRPSDKPWYTNYHRRLHRKKLRLYDNYKKKRDEVSWENFSKARSEYKKEIQTAKSMYEDNQYASLADESIRNEKKWWTLLKQVYRGSSVIESIPPLQKLDEVITDDKDKADLFNDFFLKASSIDDSQAAIPDNAITNIGPFLEKITVTYDDVKDQVETLKCNKAYGHDEVSPIFLKEGGQTVVMVLHRLFTLSLEQKQFPSMWKKANVIPLHKKDSMNVVSNYRPVSLLCVASKIFERIIFKYVFNFFRDNFVINDFQSGFQSGRSTTTQLLELCHHFCKAIDNGKEIRVVFLDIRKAFDKVWHKGLMHKLALSGIRGNLLSWFENYLDGRCQRVIINGQSSEWANVNAGVPQGSVLGPLLFLIYINDITACIRHCNTRLFADDTCLFVEVEERRDTANLINSDLMNIERWAKKWLVQFAPEKTKSLIISKKQDANLNPYIYFKDHQVEEVKSHVYLGLLFTHNLSWNAHISNVELKARKKLNMLSPLKYKLDRKSLELLFTSFVSSSIYYGIEVWGGTYDSHLLKLEHIVVDGMRLVTGATNRSNIAKLYEDTGWQSVKEHRDQAIIIMLYKIKTNFAPNYLRDLMPQNQISVHNLRNKKDYIEPSFNTEVFKRSFFPTAIRLWNLVGTEIKDCCSVTALKSKLKSSKKEANVLFYYGKRWASIHHARLRIGCSKLNFDVCYHLHIPNINPECSCGEGHEDVEHFFMKCTHYNDIRDILKRKIEVHCTFTLGVLLYGADNLPKQTNCLLFDAVHDFIMESHRFD